MAMGFELVVPVHAVNVQPDDTVAYDPPLRALWIGGPPTAVAIERRRAAGKGDAPIVDPPKDDIGDRAHPPAGVLTVTLAGEGETPKQLRSIPVGTMLHLGVVAVHDSTNYTQIIGFW